MTKREQLIEKAKSAINNMDMSDTILAHIFSDVMFSDVISCKCCPMFGKCGTGCFDVLYQWLKDHGDEEVMTNREWLETLTDEELAKWHQTVGCGSCAHNSEKVFCENLSIPYYFDPNCCIDGTAKWLQMEHKGE